MTYDKIGRGTVHFGSMYPKSDVFNGQKWADDVKEHGVRISAEDTFDGKIKIEAYNLFDRETLTTVDNGEQMFSFFKAVFQ